MKDFKQYFIFILYTVILGSISGLIIWCFIKVMNLGISFLWDYLPDKLDFKYYPIILCLIGGLVIGLWKHKFGDFPEDLNDVMKKIKQDKRYSYSKIKSSIVSALLPLVIGASIGPEAGLTGIIAGLYTWVFDKIKLFKKEFQDLTSIGLTATLGTIFKSPLFGFVEPLENEEQTYFPKNSKKVLYFIAILSSFGIFILLNKITNNHTGLHSLGKASLSNINYLYVIILIIIGIILGYIYSISHKVIKLLFKPLKNNILIKCIIGGLMLGIIGYLLPLTMFSGEEQIFIITERGISITCTMLIIISIVKIFLTNICIETGLKGGHFFPMIFAGISLGLGMSMILNIDPIISMSLVTSSFLANVLKKPLAVVLLLIIVFPINLVPLMLGAAIISSLFKMPKKIEDTVI